MFKFHAARNHCYKIYTTKGEIKDKPFKGYKLKEI